MVQEENEDAGGRRRSRSPARRMRFNRNREVGENIEKNYRAMGFIPILSYSTSADRGRLSSFVMTKYSDEHSPAIYVATLRRETVPWVLLRIVTARDDSDTFTIQDYQLRNASYVESDHNFDANLYLFSSNFCIESRI